MQPVQIGMNTVLVLIVLLLAVPLQLFLTHYINISYGSSVDAKSTETPAARADNVVVGKEGKDGERGIDTVRMEAFHRLSSGVAGVVDYVQSTFQHYSKWDNFKELFVIPYKKGNFKSGGKLFPGSASKLIKTSTVETMKHKTQSSSVKSGGKTSSSSTSSAAGSTVKKSTSNTRTSDQNDIGDKKNTLKNLKQESKEVKKVEEKEVYFSHSKVPRNPRPPQVKLKVGQVVKHRQEGYIGVIIGWDEVAKAPEEWLKRYYLKRMYVADSPHYLVLVDSRYSPSANPFHYLPQGDLEVLETDSPVQAPEVKDYFEGFRNHRHVLRPWLQEIYPND